LERGDYGIDDIIRLYAPKPKVFGGQMDAAAGQTDQPKIIK
jgi:hypothetical protein